jgi:hypothetical protein
VLVKHSPLVVHLVRCIILLDVRSCLVNARLKMTMRSSGTPAMSPARERGSRVLRSRRAALWSNQPSGSLDVIGVVHAEGAFLTCPLARFLKWPMMRRVTASEERCDRSRPGFRSSKASGLGPAVGEWRPSMHRCARHAFEAMASQAQNPFLEQLLASGQASGPSGYSDKMEICSVGSDLRQA